MKLQNTMNEDWQYLIILDACRYDYFEKNYKRFLDGKLECRKSPAIWTIEWLNNTFTKKYDNLAYISPVSFCNSFSEPVRHKGITFHGKKHFTKVYDVWKEEYGWNKEKQTILPPTINKITRKETMKHPNWRFIIHYFQPHAPFLSLDKVIELRKDLATPRDKRTQKKRYYKNLSNLLHKWFGTSFLWYVALFLGINPTTPMESAWRLVDHNKKKLKKLYEWNLIFVLIYVSELIEHLPPGKVVITADHGELLGEKKFWGHGPPKPRLPELTMVPWMVIER